MTDVITARISEEVSTPELSRMWESLRLEIRGPEIVIEARERCVLLRFHGGAGDPRFGKLKALFEQAVHRYRPACAFEWVEVPAVVV
jgi:hypothetical protein